ncbi:MAG: C4-type zinc ribbon domain-containing protein [Bacteroidales bacterium]|nr:C4-type zinc ribbon domain-containing protein [Bacteroidales bacterium]
MATDKQEKELTVEERLKALYELQTILSKIDRIKIIRGELPLEVQDLEDEIAGLETRIQNYKDEIEELNAGINTQHKAIDEAAALIDKYSQQQSNVRNNREFDFLSKEIEYQHLNIELAEKKINDFSRQIEQKHADVDVAASHLTDRKHILEEKKSELNEIVSETKQDEEKLREQAKKLEVKFDDERLLSAFKRIRKNARNGLGIVYIQRNACGGCFNRIPPQRQMEIKMHKKVIVCEYCGRIMIDPELAGIAPEVEATLNKK